MILFIEFFFSIIFYLLMLWVLDVKFYLGFGDLFPIFIIVVVDYKTILKFNIYFAIYIAVKWILF